MILERIFSRNTTKRNIKGSGSYQKRGFNNFPDPEFLWQEKFREKIKVPVSTVQKKIVHPFVHDGRKFIPTCIPPGPDLPFEKIIFNLKRRQPRFLKGWVLRNGLFQWV